MEHEHSIFYAPVNRLWEWLVAVTGLEAQLGHVEVPDPVAMSLFVVALIIAIFLPASRFFREDDPGRWQLFLEQILVALRDLIDDQVGREGAARSYLPIIGAFTVFIFLANFCGLFFFLSPPTSSINVTFALALTSFVLYNLVGLRKHGLSYFKQFLGPVLWLAPLFVIVEIVSHLARPLSLGLRLFGNITGEHTVSGVFKELAPLLVPLPLMAIGLFAATIQTFIFVILTVVYIAGAEAEEH